MVDHGGGAAADAEMLPAPGDAAAESDACESMEQLCEHAAPLAARQLSYAYNQNYMSGAALPLRMPSVVRRGDAAAGGEAKRVCGAQLEAGTTLAQEAAR